MNRHLIDAASAYLRIPRHLIVKARRDDDRGEAVVIYGPSLVKRRIPIADLETDARRNPDPVIEEPEPELKRATEPEPKIPNRRALQRMRRGDLVELATVLGVSSPDDMTKRQLVDELEKRRS